MSAGSRQAGALEGPQPGTDSPGSEWDSLPVAMYNQAASRGIQDLIPWLCRTPDLLAPAGRVNGLLLDFALVRPYPSVLKRPPLVLNSG